MKNQLCRIALSGLLATGLTLSTAAAFAQQDNSAPPAQQGGNSGGGRMGRQQMDPDQQIARMTKRYNLSADQQAQIKPILANQQQQMQALRGDSSLSRDDRMAKMKGIREDSSTKIQAILNDTQKKQFAEDQQRMQERMQERGGGGAPPTQQ
jgi:Spy/CpxP family protein refolding chaperone